MQADEGVEKQATEIDPFAARYPVVTLSANEFEQFVTDLFALPSGVLENYKVTPHEHVVGVDGEYDLDVTIRFRLLGVDFLVVVEAKNHKDPIKREAVQVLRDKVRSVGGHKGILVSTSHFQRGAIKYAETNGIALVYITEGRFTVETFALETPGATPAMTRDEATQHYGLPPLVGVYVGPIGNGRAGIAVVSPDDSNRVAELLLGVAPDA